jgi:excisionase family DNA binding protein
MPDEGPTFLTVKDICKDLQVSEQSVWRYIKSGKLNALRIGGEYRISKADYQTFLDNHRKKQPPK